MAPRPAPGLTLSAAHMAALALSNPQYEACADLATDADLREHDLDVELSETGAPSAVRLSDGAIPSRAVRCLMDRACQLRGAAGAPTRAVMPIVMARQPPPAGPPTTASIPVDIVLEGPLAASSEPTALRIRSIFQEVAAGCGAAERAVPARTQVRFVITSTTGRAELPGIDLGDATGGGLRDPWAALRFVPRPPHPPPPPPTPPPPTVTTGIRTRLLTPDVSRELLRCTVTGIADRGILGLARRQALSVVVTWNP